MATYYVNAATGNDTTGDGSEGTPWASLNPVNGAGFTWSGDDTVYVNGDVVCNARFDIDNNITILKDPTASGRPTITLLAAGAGASGITWAAGKTLTATDVIFNGLASTSAALRIDSTFKAGQITLTRVGIKFAVFGIYSVSGALLGMTDCDMQDGGASTGAGLYIYNSADGDSIVVDGLDLTMTGAIAANRGGVIIEGNHANTEADIAGVTGTIVSSTNSGYCNGVLLIDIGTAKIHGCNLDLTTHASASGSLYTIANPNITAVAAPAIYDNLGRCNSPAGIILGIGHDTYGAGPDAGLIYNNDVRGPAAPTSLHGIMARDGDDIEVWNNRVRYAVIGYIHKDTVRGVQSHNVSEFLTGTAAHHLKGAADCVVTGNTYIISSASSPRFLYVQSDALVHSTGCIFAGNAVYIYPGQTVPDDLVEVVDVNQTINFYGNNYYSKTTAFGSNWNDEGTSRTLAEWDAQSHVFGDHSFSFVPRFMGRMDHRIMKVVK